MQISETKKIQHTLQINQIYCGNSLFFLKTIADNSVDLIITSPPYFQQRNYGSSDEIGNEETEIEYLNNLLLVFSECVRILKNSGSIVFNLGDKYINGGLLLLPYKFAIKALENEKVFLINQITWSKLNPTPRQDNRKLVQATEPFFIFAKSKDYEFHLSNYLKHQDELRKITKKAPTDKLGKQYFDMIEKSNLSNVEKQRAREELIETIQLVHRGKIDGFRMKIRGIHKEAYGGMEGGRNNQIKNKGFTIIKLLGNAMKKDLIEYPVEITQNNFHPAVYPLYIVQELIQLLSSEGNLVMDPFVGSGTTCLAAKSLNRNYIGVEINPDFVELANSRLTQEEFMQEKFI